MKPPPKEIAEPGADLEILKDDQVNLTEPQVQMNVIVGYPEHLQGERVRRPRVLLKKITIRIERLRLRRIGLVEEIEIVAANGTEVVIEVATEIGTGKEIATEIATETVAGILDVFLRCNGMGTRAIGLVQMMKSTILREYHHP